MGGLVDIRGAPGNRARTLLGGAFLLAIGLFVTSVITGAGYYLVTFHAPPDIRLQHLAEADELASQGDYHRAVAAYRTSAVLTPDDLETLERLQGAASRIRDYEAAVWALRRALVIAPGNPDLRARLGQALMAAGDLDRAIEQFAAAARLAPAVAGYAYELGFALHQRGDFEAARAWFRRTLELDAGHANARYYLGGATAGLDP